MLTMVYSSLEVADIVDCLCCREPASHWRGRIGQKMRPTTLRMRMLLLATTLMVMAAQIAIAGRLDAPTRPPWAEKARMARWLVHESNYTVLASTSSHLHGAPFPNLLATSDGSSMDDCTGQVGDSLLFFPSKQPLLCCVTA